MDPQRLLMHWAALWGVPDLECRVEVSPRLRNSLGRCLVRTARIRLHPRLLEEWRCYLPEVLCHEFAHLAVERLHPGARAHGPEWRRLVEMAGFPGRQRLRLADAGSKGGGPGYSDPAVPACPVRVRPSADASTKAVSTDPSRPTATPHRAVVHRCPVCQATRRARRRMTRWVCACCGVRMVTDGDE